jgi:hypothetical protein
MGLDAEIYREKRGKFRPGVAEARVNECIRGGDSWFMAVVLIMLQLIGVQEFVCGHARFGFQEKPS